MPCARRTRPAARFPLEIRAARTPESPALIFRPGMLPRGESLFPGGVPALRAPDETDPLPASDRLETVTFRELDRLTLAIARSFAAHGIAAGERVGLLLRSGPAYPALLLGLLRAGAVAVPVSTRVPETAVPPLLHRIGCRRLVADRGEPGAAAGLTIIDSSELLLEAGSQRSAAAAALEGARLPPFDPGADATVVFTSGSTGAPKAALHSFESHWASAVGANRNLPLRPGDRWLLTLPLWHVGGLAIVFRCLHGGAAIAFAGEKEPLADAIAGLRATHVSLVPTQLYRLLREPRGRAALRGLKAVLLGGGPAAPVLIEEALQAGTRLLTSYGSTETASQATATAPGDPPEALNTAGRPLAFRQVAIAADGEILVRGRTLFRGYLEESGTRAARDPAGWFHTGDLGHFDADGRLNVTGRRDTMFISGGENIHPEEIEREILRFPGVLETIVVPVPDAEFGARPAAFLRTVDEHLPAAADLERFLRQRLPGFKVPVRYLAWPTVKVGLKPDRRALAALAPTDPETLIYP